MAEGFEIILSGFERTMEALEHERLREVSATKAGVKAAGNVVRAAAAAESPYRTGIPRDRHLRTSWRTTVEDDGALGAKAIVRSRSAKAHLVILGTAAHAIPIGHPSVRPMPIGNGRYARRVHHPGAKPNDVMVRAYAISRDEAIEAYKQTMFPGGRVP